MILDGEREPPGMGTFLLRLRLGGSEPPSGTIGALGGATEQSFHGWIDLMSAINTFRGWGPPGSSGPLPLESPSQDPGAEHQRGD